MTVKGPPYWGKYRGEVTDVDDKDKRGRIRATVRDVFGDKKSGWAEPCFAYAGPNVGLYFIPPEKAMVWIEFEHGDPERPIWTGCFLREGSNDKPQSVTLDAKKKILRTDKWMLTLDDDGTKLEIAVLEGSKGATAKARITVEKDKLKITNDKATIELDGKKVKVNDDGLQVE